MPQYVIKNVKPHTIQRGDWIYLADTQETFVASAGPIVKQKYAYVPVEHTEECEVDQLKLALDTTVKISREEPTAEEKAQQNHDHALRHIAEEIEIAPECVELRKKNLIERLDTKDASWHASAWEDYTKAQIEAQLWGMVAEVAENREIDLVAATLLVKEDTIKRLIDSRFYGGSTNEMHNVAEHIRNETRARWIRNLDYYIF